MLLVAIKARMRPHIDHNNILLVEGGHMGDAVVEADAIKEVIDFYVQKGKKVYALCSPTTWKMLKMFPFSNQLQRIGTMTNHDLTYTDMLRLHTSIKMYGFDTVVGLTSSPYLMLYAVGCIPAANKHFLVEPERMLGGYGWFLRLFGRISNAYLQKGNMEVPRSQWLSTFLRQLGIEPYELSIAYINTQCEVEPLDKKYFALVVDSSSLWKRWPVEKNIALAQELLAGLDYDLCLLGTNVDADTDQKLLQGLSDKSDRVHDFIGKTNVGEWVERIRGAEFLIGVDSGSVHIAASVGTTAFCLVGKWHGERFFPYFANNNAPNTKAPYCVNIEETAHQKLSCRNCVAKRYLGYGNPVCRKKYENGQPCLCLENITVDEVLSAICRTFEERKPEPCKRP